MSDNIIDVFKMDGYNVEEAEVIGVSGVKHYFTLLHSKDDDVVIDFSDKSDIEADLAKLIVKCRDSGISHAMLILKNNVDPDGKICKMAEENGVKIMSYSEFRDRYTTRYLTSSQP